MSETTQLWDRWHTLLNVSDTVFAQACWARFVPWVTGVVLCGGEHTLAPMLAALG